MARTEDSYDLGPKPAPPPRPWRKQVITTDLPCRKCGYNLRGLPAMNYRCPECGTLHKQEPFHDELYRGNPWWAGRMASGMVLLLAGALLFPAPLVLLMASTVQPLVAVAVGALGSVLEFAGLWLFSTPEPVPPLREGRWSLRRILRGLCLVTLATAAVVYGTSTAAVFGPPPPWVQTAGSWAPLALVLLLAARACLLGFYLHILARRLPDDALAHRVLLVSWGLVISVPPALVGVAAGATLRGAVDVRSVEVALIPMLPFLAFYGYGLFLLAVFIRDFRASALEARKTMLAEPPLPPA